MDQLNNTQIVLLVLLVSFVTSIATGIFTVTLMEQAPAGITRNINRVVEKTVETVVPTETQVVVREVIDKSEEDVIKTVEDYSPAVVTVIVDGVERSGFFVSKNGYIVTSSDNLSRNKRVELKFVGFTETVDGVVEDVSGSGRVALVKPRDLGGIQIPKIVPVKKTESTIGQRGLLLGRTTSIGANVEQGMITSIPQDGNLRVNINVSAKNLGGPFFSIPGSLLGISVNSSEGVIVPVNVLADFLSSKNVTFETSDQTAGANNAIDE